VPILLAINPGEHCGLEINKQAQKTIGELMFP
jgi:hypothetical protein